MNAEKLQHIHKVLNQSQCIYIIIIVSINNWKMKNLVALALSAGYVNKQISVKIQNQIN